jgi:hypothetical protein
VSTIVVAGREFRVEPAGESYILHGPRGARYRTMRNVPRPHLMFLVNDQSFVRSAPKAWLSDKDGTLKVVR